MNKEDRNKIIIRSLLYLAATVFLCTILWKDNNDPYKDYPLGISLIIYAISSLYLLFSLPSYLILPSLGIQFNLFIIVISVWSLSLPYSGDDLLYTVPGMIVAFVMTIFCMYRLFFKIYKEKLRTTNVYEYERISQKEKKIIDTFFDILYPNRIDDTIIQERIAAEASQKDESPFGKKYFTYACPYCGHYKVRYATWDDKRMSVAFWGMASTKIGKAYKCEHCKKVFNE